MKDRVRYSQNFLVSNQLVKSLVSRTNISRKDTVFEVGAGEGIITQELLTKAGKVIAFELDKNLFDKLSQKFKNERSLELKLQDFLISDLPKHPYIVFSNIPFNITSALIKKLTLKSSPPESAYLIIQKEAAVKFTGKPLDSKNSLMAVILNPWFEFSILHHFKPADFFPRPNVEIFLLEIKKRSRSPVDIKSKSKYEDFITYAFNQFKPNVVEGLSRVMGQQNLLKLARDLDFSPNSKPSELDFNNWIGLFNQFLKVSEKQQGIVKNSFFKLLKQQESLEKISRTRVDKNWKKFPSRSENAG